MTLGAPLAAIQHNQQNLHPPPIPLHFVVSILQPLELFQALSETTQKHNITTKSSMYTYLCMSMQLHLHNYNLNQGLSARMQLKIIKCSSIKTKSKKGQRALQQLSDIGLKMHSTLEHIHTLSNRSYIHKLSHKLGLNFFFC